MNFWTNFLSSPNSPSSQWSTPKTRSSTSRRRLSICLIETPSWQDQGHSLAPRRRHSQRARCRCPRTPAGSSSRTYAKQKVCFPPIQHFRRSSNMSISAFSMFRIQALFDDPYECERFFGVSFMSILFMFPHVSIDQSGHIYIHHLHKGAIPWFSRQSWDIYSFSPFGHQFIFISVDSWAPSFSIQCTQFFSIWVPLLYHPRTLNMNINFQLGFH